MVINENNEKCELYEFKKAIRESVKAKWKRNELQEDTNTNSGNQCHTKKSIRNVVSSDISIDKVIYEDELNRCSANRHIPRWCQLTRKHFMCFDSEWLANYSQRKPLLSIPLNSIREVKHVCLGENKNRNFNSLRQGVYYIEILLKGNDTFNATKNVEESLYDVSQKLITEELKINESELRSVENQDGESRNMSEINDLELIISILDPKTAHNKESKPDFRKKTKEWTYRKDRYKAAGVPSYNPSKLRQNKYWNNSSFFSNK